MKLYSFEKKLAKKKLWRIILGLTIIAVLLAAWWLVSWILKIILSIPTLLALFVFWNDGLRPRKYDYFRQKKTLSQTDRLAIETEFQRNCYLQIGEAIFLESYILLLHSTCIIPYSQLVWCYHKDGWAMQDLDGPKGRFCILHFATHPAIDLYQSHMTPTELSARDSLLTQMYDLLKRKNPKILLRYSESVEQWYRNKPVR